MKQSRFFVKCPICEGAITERPRSYACKCGLTIWKEMAGKKITPEIIAQLVRDGRTPVLEGFRSRSGRPFSAALILRDNKVAFEFQGKEKGVSRPEDVQKPAGNNVIPVRVESGNSGTVHLSIGSPVPFTADIDYGLVSSRMAECLGCITAAGLVKSSCKNITAVRLDISLNNLDFSRYLLRERVPRDTDVKKAVEHLWSLLQEFGGWQAQYRPSRKPRLKGSPQAGKFPRGVFPGLQAEITENGDELTVALPDSPDIQAQFRASIWKAVPGDNGTFTVPAGAKQTVLAWLNSVRGGRENGLPTA